MRSSHTLRGGRLPAALALIGLALLGLLFVPECDDCYFVYWSFDSLISMNSVLLCSVGVSASPGQGAVYSAHGTKVKATSQGTSR